jgi:hypothetical protein
MHLLFMGINIMNRILKQRWKKERHCIPLSRQVTETLPWGLRAFLDFFSLRTVIMFFPGTNIFTYVCV